MVQKERSWKEHLNLMIFIQFSKCLNKKHKIIWFHLIFRVYFFGLISILKSYVVLLEYFRMLHSVTELSIVIMRLIITTVAIAVIRVKSVFGSMKVKSDTNKIDCLAEGAFPIL